MAAPVISHDELAAFHATHFSSTAVEHFAVNFLGPVEEEQYMEEEEEDDGLGYYEDGTKRTLTDEQIAIFRHSEIQALMRERRRAAEAKEEQVKLEPSPPIIGPIQPRKRSSDLEVKVKSEEGEYEDGEFGSSTDAPTPTSQSSNSKQSFSKRKAKKGERGKQRGYFKQNVKPDLRKRTWDVVDEGLGSLDYEEGASTATPTHTTQRRRISYDDD
ncbi:hypothetical protein BDZ45DRAFT_736438 [Acephala macrosclerotiorum]|nr:hypothetical protein BDZ45DRAFT_736438 [Acephala macrosclerotiorum]